MAEPAPAFYSAVRVRAEIEPAVRNWPEENRIAQLRFIEAWSKPLDPLDQVVRDVPGADPWQTRPGWAAVLDPALAPAAWLNWLAQFTGTRIFPADTEEQKRGRIEGMEGLRRGSPGAIESAIRRTLADPDNNAVFINERAGSAWRYSTATLASQTPDPGATARAALRQKPAGDITSHQVLPDTVVGTPDNSYTTLKFTHSDYQDLKTTFADYAEIKTDSDKQ